MSVKVNSKDVHHLMHVFDDRELKIRDLKDILFRASNCRFQFVEKLDGLNVSFTVRDKVVLFARSATDIKTGGLCSKDVQRKFSNRKNLCDAYEQFLSFVQSIVDEIDSNTLNSIFCAGNTWFSAEIIFPQNRNVILYSQNMVVLHKSPIFKVENSAIKIVKVSIAKLSQIFAAASKKMRNENKSEWIFTGPVRANVVKRKEELYDDCAIIIDDAVNAANLNDDSTLEEFVVIGLKKQLKHLSLKSEVEELVIARTLERPGSSLTEIKKLVDNKSYSLIKQFVENNRRNICIARKPIELAIHNFESAFLAGVNSTFVKDADDHRRMIQCEVEREIKKVISNGTVKSDTLAFQLEKLGSLKSLCVTTEGVVFSHKGKNYKFTGNFAPVNQILGYLRYGGR